MLTEHFRYALEEVMKAWTGSLLFFVSLLLTLAGSMAQSNTGRSLALSPTNTTIAFTVDSTWHTVHGKATDVSGVVNGDSLWKLSSLNGEVTIPVTGLDTESSMRDKKMRTVMHASEHPTISFRFNQGRGNCSRASSENCRGELPGTLTIAGVSLPVMLAVEYLHHEGTLTVQASTTIRWADFGVEDPSILVARVAPETTIAITVKAL